MDIKKFVIGGITGGILFFFLGWLVYGILLMDFMKANPGIVSGFDKAQPEMLYLVIGNLISGFLLAYIFVKANVNSLANGFITAAIIGLLMSASYDCMNYALTNLMSKKMIIADVLAAVAVTGIIGAIVGLVLGKLNKAG